jgi:hypothetical protein
MPTISMFYGIIIRIYCGNHEHNPPHFHAYYGDCRAIFDMESCIMIEGDFPSKQRRLVEAWTEIHRDELWADWRLASEGEKPMAIDPLR